MSDDIERQEIEKLLPWYVTGRLGRADTSKVEGYLGHHPHMLTQLSLMRSEHEETTRANEAIGWPSAGMADRLMALLPRGRESFAGGEFLSSIGQFFTMPTARRVQWAAVVAGLLVLAQAVVIVTLITLGSDHAYQTASGDSQRVGVTALVAFADEATAPAIARLLTEFDANIVDGPKPGGIYKVMIARADRSQPVREALLRKLAERRDVIRIVLPSRD